MCLFCSRLPQNILCPALSCWLTVLRDHAEADILVRRAAGGSGVTGGDQTPSPDGPAEKTLLRDIRPGAGGATDGWGPGR